MGKRNKGKGFTDINGNIIDRPFANDFGNNTYYVDYTIGGTSNYHMGYVDLNKKIKLTENIAHIIDGPFATIRKNENFLEKNPQYNIEDSRIVWLMNPNTGEIIDPFFADRVFTTTLNTTKGISGLTNSGLVDHRLDSEIRENILLRYKKDGKVGLCDQNGNIIQKPFADEIDVDGLFIIGDNVGIINLFNGDIIFSFENAEIYQPNIENNQTDYILKSSNGMEVLELGELNIIMLELLKLKSR